MNANAPTAQALGSFDRASRLMSLNLDTANAIFEDSVAYACALMQAKGRDELADLQAERPVRAVEKAVAYCSGVYALSEPKDRVALLIESQFWACNSPVGAALEQIAEARANGEDPVADFQPGLDATLAALDQLLRLSRRSAEMARLELELIAEAIASPDESPAEATPPRDQPLAALRISPARELRP